MVPKCLWTCESVEQAELYATKPEQGEKRAPDLGNTKWSKRAGVGGLGSAVSKHEDLAVGQGKRISGASVRRQGRLTRYGRLADGTVHLELALLGDLDGVARLSHHATRGKLACGELVDDDVSRGKLPRKTGEERHVPVPHRWGHRRATNEQDAENPGEHRRSKRREHGEANERGTDGLARLGARLTTANDYCFRGAG